MMALILAAFLVFPSQRSSDGPTVSSSSIDPERAATSADIGSGEPTLTTVHQPVVQAGAELVAALLMLLKGERAPARTLPVHLVVRASAP